MLKQNTKIVFTNYGKQRPLSELTKEVQEMIEEFEGQSMNATNTTSDIDATSLVGRKINHKFSVNGEEVWYTGNVISYNNAKKLQTIIYDGEDEPCYFNLLEDLEIW